MGVDGSTALDVNFTMSPAFNAGGGYSCQNSFGEGTSAWICSSQAFTSATDEQLD